VSCAKPAYASIYKSGNVAITTARERKRHPIVCALFTARAVSDGKKSANNLLSLSFSSCSYSHVARFMNASIGWFGARHYISPNYCYII